MRYHVMASKEGNKIKERISLPAEKLFILVSTGPRPALARLKGITQHSKAQHRSTILPANCTGGIIYMLSNPMLGRVCWTCAAVE